MSVIPIDCPDCGVRSFAIELDPETVAYNRASDEAFLILSADELQSLYFTLKEEVCQ